jgi:hypothetical protein
MKALLLSFAVLAACTDTRAPIKGAQSIQVDLISPTDPGSLAVRLPDTARTVTIKLTALGPDGQIDTTYNRPLQVYTQFLGTLTPYINTPSATTVQMVNGSAMLANYMLPPVFGPTSIWVEDGCYLDFTGSATPTCDNGSASYATGSSPTLWFRDPFIADIRCSTDAATCAAQEAGSDPYGTGPIDNKNVTVLTSRYGATGRLVITSKYAQGYTLADVNCADMNGTPPCTSMDYDYIDVYSYSAPLDQEKRFLNEGQSVDGFSGGVSEFDGLLEMGFPQTFVNCATGAANCPDVNTAREPTPKVVDMTWFTNTILFKRNEANNLEIDNAVVCPLDAAYDQYKEWKLDLTGTGTNCTNNVIDVVSSGIFDPSPYVGMKIPKIIGNERSINIGTFHVFIIYPRSMSDFTLP